MALGSISGDAESGLMYWIITSVSISPYGTHPFQALSWRLADPEHIIAS
jgi:hypothetical protein